MMTASPAVACAHVLTPLQCSVLGISLKNGTCRNSQGRFSISAKTAMLNSGEELHFLRMRGAWLSTKSPVE